MENRKFDKIIFRIGIILTVIAAVCLIIVPKPSAEFIISIVSGVISLIVTIVALIRILTDKDKK